ncbi:MAG: PAS domain S-box protein, partial [Nitrospiraceae bacterium]|nr:PAS domain S-box protein [Nitrospiraceae bacterium]
MENERKTRGEFKKELSSMHLQAEELEEILSIKRQPDDLFGALIAISPVAIYIVRDSKIRAVSTGFQKITGYRANELLGMHPLRIVLPDDRETVRKEAIKMLKKERSSPYEFRLCTRDGKIKWILETVTSIRYQGKRAVLGNFMDITAQKEAERIKTLLYRISKTAISASSLEDFFASMHQIIRELMPAENFSVALYDPDQDTVSFPYFVDE